MLLDIFLKGIHPRSQVEIIKREITNLKDAMEFAAKLKLARAPSKDVSSFRSGYNDNTQRRTNKLYKDAKCFKCNKFGHYSSECYSVVDKPTNEFKKPYKKFNNPGRSTNHDNGHEQRKKDVVKCYKCNGLNHKANECKKVNMNSNYQNKRSNLAVVEENEEMPSIDVLSMSTTNPLSVLSLEKMNEHERAPAKPEKLELVDVYVNNCYLKAVIDTGATCSIISEHAALKQNFKISPSTETIRTADNSITPTLGVIQNAKVVVQGRVACLNLIVFCHKQYELLLGLDWFKQTRAGIFPSSGRLVFETASVEADNNNDTWDVLTSEVAESDISEEDEDIDWDINMKLIPPTGPLNVSDSSKFKKLIKKHRDCFAFSLKELSCCNVRKHEIHLNSLIPLYKPPYRKSEVERKEMRDQVDEMLKANIIRKSRSPYSSPVILVPKPNGTKRMVIDYRPLNNITITQNWPLPLISDIMDDLAGGKIFSKLDLKSGYWQVAMSECSIEKTAFSTPDGHYEFLRLPFGLTFVLR